MAGAFSLIFQAIAVLVFPISYAIFSFFYSMYGAVLYVVGPLVLALYPALGVGQLARTFMVNLLVWNAWGIIYAIISQLLTIMSANSLTSIFTSQSFGGAFQGASQMLLISLSSILLSIMILLIPFIAKRVVSGDVGSTMLTVVGVAAAAVQAAIAGWAGMQGGAASAAGGGDDHRQRTCRRAVRRRPRRKLVQRTGGVAVGPSGRVPSSDGAAAIGDTPHHGRPREKSKPADGLRGAGNALESVVRQTGALWALQHPARGRMDGGNLGGRDVPDGEQRVQVKPEAKRRSSKP